jgi:hypothetical protein
MAGFTRLGDVPAATVPALMGSNRVPRRPGRPYPQGGSHDRCVAGALGPAFYGALIGNGSSRTGLFVGYLIGAGIMVIGGLVEVFLGVNAAGKSLEQVTKPLTSVTDEAAPAVAAPA